MGLIYKITNTKTGKMYVGQTTISLKQRWEEHKSKAKNSNENYLLYQVMRRSGIKNFTIEVIEKCSNDLLDEREKHWIKKLGTYGNGYNMTEGGDSFRKEVISQQTINKWWRDFNNGISLRQISKQSGYSVQVISKRLKDKQNYQAIAKRNVRGCKTIYLARTLNTILYVYDLHGNKIGTTRLENETLKDRQNILECVRGWKRSHKGKKYCYADLPPIEIELMYERFVWRRKQKRDCNDLRAYYKTR